LTQQTLAIQGLDDIVVPGGARSASDIYHASPASMTNKVLVQAVCATHEVSWEGCSRSVQAGRFGVDASGVARPTGM
jgi:hypothetical protein